MENDKTTDIIDGDSLTLSSTRSMKVSLEAVRSGKAGLDAHRQKMLEDQRKGKCFIDKVTASFLARYLISLDSLIHTVQISMYQSQFSQSCPTLCDPMDCSTPGFSVFTISWSLLKLMSIEPVMPSNHLILCHPLIFPASIFPSITVFQMTQFFMPGDHSTGVSTSASVLPTNIQD